MRFLFTYFTKLQLSFAIAVLAVVSIGLTVSQSVYAATGINRTINFQGKLVDNNGLNVADSTYSVVFSFYDVSSSGTALWTETQSVTTVDGIFRVSLGSSTAFPAGFNFNWDGLYLGMKVGADAEMTPRIRMAAVPYAFNAEKVAGLTVQDENGNASTSGTLKIPNGKTISFGGAFTTTAGNDLTLTTSGNTTLSLGGSGSLTLVDTSTSQTLTGKIIGSGGLTFTGATTDITTGTNENFVLSPNGTGLIGLGTTTPGGFLHVYGGSQGGNALATFDQIGASSNDIFTASAAGNTRFVIKNNGNIGIGTSLPLSTLYLNGTTTGNAALTVVQNTATGDLFTASAGASTKFVIDRAGNVGIGTANPTGFNLDVTGTARFTGAITVASCTGCSGSSAFSAITGGTNSTAAMIIDTGASLTFSNSGTINASSLLGNTWASPGTIGGTTPGIATFTALTANTSLFVAGNVGIGSTAVTPTWLTISSQNKTATGKALAILDQYENQDIFAASRSGVSRFVIQNNGNIGVGTTLPASTLYLNGTTTGNAALTVVQNTATGDLFTASAGASTKFVIDRAGNVGIGTANPTKMLYVYNGDAQFDYGNLNFTTLSAPSAPSVAINVAAGNLNGSYTYKVTFVTANGGETAASLASSSVAPVNQQVDISAIPTGTSGVVTARKIYRKKSTSTSHQLVATISDNVTTTYTDNITDTVVNSGANEPSINTTAGNMYVDGTRIFNVNAARSSTAFGPNALSSYSSGSSLTAIGYNALAVLTSGSQNTAVGASALAATTTGGFNVALGASALSLNTTGANNAASGLSALRDNITGSFNSGFGNNTLKVNKTGSKNTAAGYNALNTINPGLALTNIVDQTGNVYRVTTSSTTGLINGNSVDISGTTNFNGTYTVSGVTGTTFDISFTSGTANETSGYWMITGQGSSNVAFGYNAGFSNVTGSGNVNLGFEAGYSETGSNKLYIANSRTATPLIYGDFAASGLGINTNLGGNGALVINQANSDGDILSASSSGSTKFTVRQNGNIGIGTSLPASTLYLNGTTTGNAALTVVQNTATGDLFTASAGASTKFVIDRAGNVGIGTSVPSAYNLDVTGTARFTGAITVASCSGCGGAGTNYFQMNDGAVSPFSNTLDLLVGGTATDSAKFAVLNMTGSGTPTASISAQSGTKTALSFSSNGSIQSVNMNTLTIGGLTTGNILLSPNNGTGYVNIGTSSVNAFQFDLTQASTKTLSLGIDTVADGILKLFSSGAGKTAPTIYADSTGNLNLSAPSASVKIGSGTSGNINFHLNSASDVLVGSKIVSLSGSYSSINDFSFLRTLTGGTNAISGGSVFKITDTSTGTSTTSTDDMLLINQATTNPNWAGNLINAQIGGITKFKVSGYGTVAGATVSPTTSFAALTTINNGVGDLFTASAGATPKFVITNSGNVGIGTTLPTSAKLVVSESTAPVVDMTQIINSTGTSTTGVDGLQVDFKTAGTTASADNSGLRVNVTAGGTGTTATLEGIDIANLAGAASGNVTETALRVGTGWDKGLVFTGAEGTYTVQLASDAHTLASGITFGTSSPMSVYKSANGQITIGDGTNGLVLDASTGPTYTSGMRPTKTITLSPEYAGAILTASGSATTNGSMTSDASNSAALTWRNYYQWTSTQTSLQDYTVGVAVTLPTDFSDWVTSNAIQVSFNTGLTTSNTNKLDLFIYNTTDSTATPVVYRQSQVSATAKTWTTVNVDRSDLVDSPTWNTAGQRAVFYFKMSAKDNNYVQISAITLNYLAKF